MVKKSCAFLGNRSELNIRECPWTVNILFSWMRSHVDFQVVAELMERRIEGNIQ